MKHSNLLKLGINITLLIALFFILFIVAINIIKFVDYFSQVKNVITSAEKNGEIKTVNSDMNNINIDHNRLKYDPSRSYLAEELGYKNDLFDLDGSEWGEGINIMLVGSDKNSFSFGKARSDVIIVFRITSSGRILSISIPRDSLIVIKGGKWSGSYDKIGHCLYWGGMDNLKKSVEDILGSPIYKVAIIDNFINFEAFLAIVGGMKIDKELEGRLGIQWIRNREFRDGDIGRCKRQQVFLKRAVIKLWKMSKNGSYLYSGFFYDMFRSIIYTDLTRDEFLKIIYILKKNRFNPADDFLTGVLPGSFGRYDSKLLNHKNVVCWNLDEKFLENLRFLLYSNSDSYKYIMAKKAGFMDFFNADFTGYFKAKK